MTDPELQELVEQISLNSFERPFSHTASFNQRLRTTGGRYVLASHNIEINPKMLSEHDQATLVGVIKHELCHYHLHLLHAGYQHRDRAFKQLLQAVGGSRYAPRAQKGKIRPKKYLYQCVDCGQLYPRARRVDLQKYRCSLCQGRLTLVRIQKN